MERRFGLMEYSADLPMMDLTGSSQAETSRSPKRDPRLSLIVDFMLDGLSECRSQKIAEVFASALAALHIIFFSRSREMRFFCSRCTYQKSSRNVQETFLTGKVDSSETQKGFSQKHF